MSTTENGVVPSSGGIVPEVLNGKQNYEEWSIRLRTYLIAHGVWDVVELTPDEAEDKANWKRKDGIALHAIHISCGSDAFSAIKHNRNAKEAWNTLAIWASMAESKREISPATAEPPKTLQSVALPQDKRSMSTAEKVVVPSSGGIVPEVLNGRQNYEEWSIRLRTYLIAQDVWNIVESTPDEAEDKANWKRKDAKALQSIHISCGPDAFSVIKHIRNAKEAWNTLAIWASLAESEGEISPAMAEPPKTLQSVALPQDKRSMSTAKNNVVPSSGGLVPGKENYEEWSIRLRTYLIAQDVWNVVESTPDEPDDKANWKTKDAKALHAIHIFCGPDAFSAIKHIRNAKEAWDTLAKWASMAEPPKTLQSVVLPQENIISADEVLKHERLNKAVWKGDCRETNWIVTRDPDVVKARITFSRRTPLHMAAMAGHINIVKILVQKMSEQDLEITDKDGMTALAVAITCNAELLIAECMLQKNIRLLTIEANNVLPVAMAFSYGHKEMGRYLYSITPLSKDYLQKEKEHGARILCDAIYMQSFDVALDLLSVCKELAITLDPSGRSPVYALANFSSAFPSGCHLRFWQRWLYKCICIDSTCAKANLHKELKSLSSSMTKSGKDLRHKAWSKFQELLLYVLKILGIKDIYDKKLVHVQTSELLKQMCEMTKTLDVNKMEQVQVIEALFLAVDRGNVEFVKSLLKENPELGLATDKSLKNIFMRAIEFRQQDIFNLIYKSSLKLSATSALADKKNNMLHIAARLAHKPQLNRNPGAALQMQRELQWFQEVKSIVPPWALDRKNLEENTPDELFTKEHKELLKEGEKWMKETATSCTVVGALIITIMFAAAITVPGGNKEDSGFPIFLNKKLFMLFIVSDSISLFSSTTSVLMFLGILTSRYAQGDFLHSLPTKLMFGLFTLFISIAFMMVAFSATLLVLVRDKYSWVLIPVICFAIIPVLLFAFMQFRLLVEILWSTYLRGIFDKKVKI